MPINWHAGIAIARVAATLFVVRERAKEGIKAQ
jgi:hypothetical protein